MKETTLVKQNGWDADQRASALELVRELETTSLQDALRLVAELQEADRNKNEFLNALSHELRNPMATILAGLQLLEAKTGIENDKTFAIIKRQMHQMCGLVDDLLDITRITTNKIVLKKEALDLCDIVLSLTRDFMPRFEAKEVQLQVDLAPESIFVNADPIRMSQMLGNLLHNALKFTPQKTGKVSISLSTEKGQAVLCIRDNGVGIDPAFLPLLFEPFKQADSNINRKRSGLGLGLSIVKGLAELHDGTVYAESAGLNRGAAFYIQLPVSQDAFDTAAEPRQLQENAQALRVLLIDDNCDFVELLCQSLQYAGHTVALAFDGYEGIQKAEELVPQVILCDIGLGEMDGFEFARRARNSAALKDSYLIAMTGYASAVYYDKAIDAGFNRAVTKPIDLPALNMMLSQLS